MSGPGIAAGLRVEQRQRHTLGICRGAMTATCCDTCAG